MTPYAPFDLLITASPQGFQARYSSSPAGNASTDFTLPFDEGELASFLWNTLGVSYDFDVIAFAAQQAMDADQFGRRLYDAVFAGGVGACLQQSLAIARERGSGLRIRLRIAEDLPRLADLPWEYLKTPPPGAFLALSDDTPLVRYLEVGRPAPPVQVTPPLTVLAVLSSPLDLEELAVDKEWTRLREALDGPVQEGLLRLERLPDSRLDTLQARCARGRCICSTSSATAFSTASRAG